MLVLLPFFFAAVYGEAVQPLQSYNIRDGSVTVSGPFGGGIFAHNIRVAHSASVKGVGTFDGGPYWCAGGDSDLMPTRCLTGIGLESGPLIVEAEERSDAGDIDHVRYLNNSKVYIYHGTNDPFMLPVLANKIEEFYTHFGGDIASELSITGGHAFPTDNFGVECGLSLPPFITDCQYTGAFIMLQHLYGNLNQPSPAIGQLLQFRQDEYYDGRSFEEFGYIYIPTMCNDLQNACKLHVAFHGCTQTIELIGEDFVRHAGYLETAEANDIIVIFPQIKASIILPVNPLGCFDFWGYDEDVTSNKPFATKNGKQVQAIKAMVDRVTGHT